MYAPAAESERSARVWGALLAVYLIWGSTFLAIRVALEGFPPLLVSPLRFTLAGGALFLALRARGYPLPQRREWLNSLFIGALFCGANSLLVIGEQWVSSGLAAVVIASVPLWAALFAGLFGRWPIRREWAGLAVGFAGVMLLNAGADLRTSPLGGLALLASAAIWALGSIWSRRLSLPQGLMSSAAQMLCGGAVLLTLALLGGERPAQMPSPRAISALVYLTAAGSIVGYSAFSFLVRSVRPALATSYAYVNPLIAVALGALVAGERVRPATLGGLALILAGVSAIVRSG
ncbi:MAG: drug/metabolite exporter YedA [Deltaproteobacteria bacterium]|nr:MAG: drug/metabolite exporter YedA [Deltaproteobacteria bacterium]